jgi:hypothetical protein
MNFKEFEVPDIVKVAILVIGYTFYITWWASGIQTQLESMNAHLEAHLGMNNHPLLQTIAIESLTKAVDLHTLMLGNMVQDHAGCKEVIKGMARRLTHLEDIEDKAHGRAK